MIMFNSNLLIPVTALARVSTVKNQ
uniref:Uncharacterized protein n=1 Tax=Arundo donax TaxID=35708 RepID=A0A0A9CKV0_ARUDO